MFHFNPGVLVTPVNEFPRLERKTPHLPSEDPCRLVRPVDFGLQNLWDRLPACRFPSQLTGWKPIPRLNQQAALVLQVNQFRVGQHRERAKTPSPVGRANGGRGEAVKKLGQAPRSYAKSLQNADIRSEPRYPDIPQEALSCSLPDRAGFDEEAKAVACFGKTRGKRVHLRTQALHRLRVTRGTQLI